MPFPCCAKIVATLGPASANPETLNAMFDAGVNVFRLNFSHGEVADHKRSVEMIRAMETEKDTAIGIIADLQGPKLRIGNLADGEIHLTEGNTFHLDLDPTEGNEERVCVPHPEVFLVLKAGNEILLNDGRIRLEVTMAGEARAETIVRTGGTLSSRKGLNLPNVILPLSAITEKDVNDLRHALEMEVDWVALSFVQRPEDVEKARKLVDGRAGLISKLERPGAIDRLDNIVALSDALMIARGDLGVELPPEAVPMLQKRIIDTCRKAGRPVIVATQMLESMIHAPTPTRAEASDVATAIYDGTDAVMLSAETATGKYPVESVAIMQRIIMEVEQNQLYVEHMEESRRPPKRTEADAITAAARQVAQTLNAAAIVSFTMSGYSTLKAARERPSVPILSLTPTQWLSRRMALVWGTTCKAAPDIQDFPDIEKEAARLAKNHGFAKAGEKLIITAGIPFGQEGTTNILRIATIPDA